MFSYCVSLHQNKETMTAQGRGHWMLSHMIIILSKLLHGIGRFYNILHLIIRFTPNAI